MPAFLSHSVPASSIARSRAFLRHIKQPIASRAVLLSLVLCVPGQSNAQEWWQGIWAADAAWCAMSDQIGNVTPAPIALTETEIVGYENSCTISDVIDMPKVAATRLTLRCQSEGSSFVEDRLVMAGDKSSLWMWFGYGEPMRFHRCG